MNINSTLFFQVAVFLVLCGFTIHFVWPPIMKALDERAKKVADSLAAADKAKEEVKGMELKVEEQLAALRNEGASQRAEAERQAEEIVEAARSKAHEEATRIIASAKEEAVREADKARDALRTEVAALAVKGAEQILRKEINASNHAQLLDSIKAEL